VHILDEVPFREPAELLDRRAAVGDAAAAGEGRVVAILGRLDRVVEERLLVAERITAIKAEALAARDERDLRVLEVASSRSPRSGQAT
jgi:hypothetical protein